MPGSLGTAYSTNSPPVRSPRQTFMRTSAPRGAWDADARGSRAQPLDAHERFLELALCADDPDELLHRVLEIGLDLVGVFVARALERRGDRVGIRPELGLVDARGRAALGVVGG